MQQGLASVLGNGWLPRPASELTLAFSRIARVDLGRASVVSGQLNQLAGPGFVSGLDPNRPESAGELSRVRFALLRSARALSHNCVKAAAARV